MGVYARGDSRFWWMQLEGTKRKLSTGIPIGTGARRRDSKLEADDIYRAAMGDLARGRFQITKAKPAITFRAWCEWYWEHVARHHRCASRERSMLRTFTAAFGDTPLHEITTKRLETWISARTATHHRHTLNREIDVLKPLFRKAIPEYLAESPADPIKRFPSRPVPITILSPSAERALLADATAEERAMVLLGLDALLRLSDVRTLKVEHDKGTHLEIVNPKTDPYKVPVSRRLRAALDALTPRGGYYFARRYRQAFVPMGRATAHDLFADLCDRAHVTRGRARSGVTFHSLRHTGATRAASTVKLTVVQRLGGWKSLKQLARYDHPDDPELVRAVEAIGLREDYAAQPETKHPAKIS